MLRILFVNCAQPEVSVFKVRLNHLYVQKELIKTSKVKHLVMSAHLAVSAKLGPVTRQHALLEPLMNSHLQLQPKIVTSVH